MLFTQDEDHCVVAETAARMDGDGSRLVDHEDFPIVHQDLQRRADYGRLMAMHGVPHVVVILQNKRCITYFKN